MLSTRNPLLIFLTIWGTIFSCGNMFCQEDEGFLDTLDYLPLYYKGALDNNLMVAASRGYEGEIERLIKKGANINAETYEGATPLVFAVANDQLLAVKKLLTYNPELNYRTSNNETPLIIAVKNQNVEIAEVLIREGADIDLANYDGITALHYAALNGSFKIVDFLLYYEADCNIKTNDGTTPLMVSILAGYNDIADLLVQNGANLEARDKNGFTPFLIASQVGDTLLMNMLLKDGVNIYERNNSNYNALDLAIETNQKSAVKLLLEKGDKWGTEGNETINPYRLATALGRKDIIEMLENKNIVSQKRVRIEEISVSGAVLFNTRDYFTEVGLSFREPVLDAGILVLFDIKPDYTRILMKTGENTYYQYYDKSSMISGGVFKNFTISERANGSRFAVSTSLLAGYKFGNKFKGTNTAPESKLKVIPAAGLMFQKKGLTLRAEIEYLNSDFYRIGPLWFRTGFSYNTFISKIRIPVKTIKWD